MIYWKHSNEAGVQPMKVNLIIYENDVLQVSGWENCKQNKHLSMLGDWIQLLPLDSGLLSRDGKAGGYHHPRGNFTGI